MMALRDVKAAPGPGGFVGANAPCKEDWGGYLACQLFSQFR
jgi:hypothetical protein